MARLDIDRLAKRYGDFHAVRDVSLDGRGRRVPRAAGPVGLRQDHDAAHGRGLRRADRRPRAARRRATSPLLPPWKRNTGMVFQSYALFPHLTVAQNVAFGLEMRKLPTRRRSTRASRRRCALVRLDGLRRAPAAPALGRPAAARGAGPRAGDPARRAAARRAAVQPRRQAAPGGAGRDPRAAAPARPHHGDGDARPGGGADHGRPAGGDERGRGPPGRHASATSTSARPTASSPASSAAATSCAGTVDAPGRFRTDGGLDLACAGGTPGTAVLALRPERLEIAPGAAGGTRQRLSGHGGIRLLSRRADRHRMCACRPPTGWWCRSPTAPAASRPSRANGSGRLAAAMRPARYSQTEARRSRIREASDDIRHRHS